MATVDWMSETARSFYDQGYSEAAYRISPTGQVELLASTMDGRSWSQKSGRQDCSYAYARDEIREATGWPRVMWHRDGTASPRGHEHPHWWAEMPMPDGSVVGWLAVARREDASRVDDYQQRLIDWALEYDGYGRFTDNIDYMNRCFAPLKEDWDRNNRIPVWAGVDLLRAWAFYCVRGHHFDDWQPLHVASPEFRGIVDAIRNHPAVKESDLPPKPD